MALLSFDSAQQQSSYHPWTEHDPPNDPGPRRPWSSYGLLALVFVFILAPQPSILLLSVSYYLLTQQSRSLFIAHMIGSYTLLFMMLSSLMVLLVRDPGTVKPLEELEREQEQEASDARGDQVGEQNEDISLAEALLSNGGPDGGDNGSAEAFSLTPVKSTGEGRWCRKCWAPKPERTHHCSECNRCVLKMDHHCPWLANRCVGARTYPSFLHFLLTTTIYSTYMFMLAVPPIQYFIGKPLILDDQDMTPYHAMTVALVGAFFSLTVGSFFVYHVYLTLTNQTTLESLAPMLLLQYLPDIPAEPSTTTTTSNHSDMHSYPPLQLHGHDDIQPPPFSSRPPSPTSASVGTTPAARDQHQHQPHSLDHLDPDSHFHTHSPPPYAPPPPSSRAGQERRSHMFDEPYRFPSPPPNHPSSNLNQPPQAPKRFLEHELNKKQRQIVRDAHSHIRIYDLGWKENLLQVLGGGSDVSRPGKPRPSQWRVWAERIFWGGRGRGDGHSFRHNPKAEGQLRILAQELLAAASR